VAVLPALALRWRNVLSDYLRLISFVCGPPGLEGAPSGPVALCAAGDLSCLALFSTWVEGLSRRGYAAGVELGRHLDSLADMVSFLGVTPACVDYSAWRSDAAPRIQRGKEFLYFLGVVG